VGDGPAIVLGGQHVEQSGLILPGNVGGHDKPDQASPPA